MRNNKFKSKGHSDQRHDTPKKTYLLVQRFRKLPGTQIIHDNALSKQHKSLVDKILASHILIGLKNEIIRKMA